MGERPVCLSIRQPWAWLIVHRHKAIENRSWPTWKRGQILIHAGKAVDHEAIEALRCGWHPVTYGLLSLEVPDQFETSGIVGAADLVDCVQQSDSEWFVGPHGFVLANARPLPFVPCRGALGFFKLPEAAAS